MKYLITENFGKKLNLFFTDKCKISNNVILTKQNETLNDKKKIQHLSRVFHGNKNFRNEGCCKKIKENFDNENFFFEAVSKKDVLDLIKEFPRSLKMKLLF